MSIRKLTLTTLVSLGALAGGLLFSGSAQAALTHAFLPVPSEAINRGVPAGAKAAGGEEALSGPFGGGRSALYGMTVAPGEAPGEPGHLWIAEGGRVDEFNASSGAWELQLEHAGNIAGGNDALEYGVAVGGATGEREVYVVAEGGVAVFGPAGKLQDKWTGSDTPEGSFVSGNGYVSAVAVDASTSMTDWAKGDVFVVKEKMDVVDVFKPKAGGGEEYVTQLKGRCPVPGLTVGGPSCEGAEVVPFAASYGHGVAVDSATGDLLVSDGSGVDFFEPVGLNEYRYLRRVTGIPGHSFAPHAIRNVTAGGVEEGGDIYVSEAEYNGAGVVVYQFSSEGVYLDSLTGTTPASPFDKVQGVAVDPANGDVYVGDERESPVVDAFGPGVVVPDVTTGVASQVTPASAMLSGTVNPLGEGAATCRFALGTTSELGQPPVACSAGVPEGGAPVDVRSEALEGLQPDTTYYYRLQATNRNGTNTGEGVHAECEGKPSEDGCFLTLGPGIEGESVSDVASTSATLDAEIDPNHAPASYYFEYGPTTAYGSDVPSAAGGAIGSQKGLEPVSQHVHGLSPGSVYHYRVVVVSELSIEVAPGSFETKVETFAGADGSFTTQSVSAFALPDGREWELVSPPNKHGALVEPINQESLSQAAVGGDAITYETNAPTEPRPLGDTNNTQVLSVRGPSGWVSQDLTIPHESVTGAGVGEGEEYRAFSEDLSLGALQPFGAFVPSLSPEASESTAFLHTVFVGAGVGDLCTESCYRPLVTGCPPVGQPCPPSVSENADVPAGTVFGPHPAGSNNVAYGPGFEGGSRDFSHVVLTSAATGSAVPLDSVGGSLYEWSGGELSPISVLPDGVGVNGILGNHNGQIARNAISDDGSRVVWSDESTNVLYMRYNATQPQSPISLSGECTVRTDACTLQIGAGFQDASSDGSRVFFGDAEADGSLYECEIFEEAGGGLGCRLSSLGGPGAVVLGASEDGSWVYFVSGDGLDVRHAGVTKLIAVLSSEDSQHYRHTVLGDLTARVSPDGHWLAFMSRRELVPGDVTRDALSGEPDEEVYLYNGETEKLVCASCDPTGARPVGEKYPTEYDRLFSGNGVWEPSTWLAANIPGWTTYKLGRALHQSRYLSDSGRLFFNSRDPLVPQAVNGTWDVYEYEPPGVGSCSASSSTFSAHTGGCVGLISSGTSESESAFLDASESGGDVFFLTKSRLAPQDYDNAVDVYDAHECTTLAPCFPAAALVPASCTTGDACKPAPTPQPAIYGAPSSATFSGAGNVVPSAGVTSRALTRAQKLAGALKACRKRAKKKRAACKRRARRAYGASARAKGSDRKGGR